MASNNSGNWRSNVQSSNENSDISEYICISMKCKAFPIYATNSADEIAFSRNILIFLHVVKFYMEVTWIML